MTACRGVRGATTADENSQAAILDATRDLLEQMATANQINVKDIASIFFTTTPDLNEAFPAAAARQMGWTTVAMMCGHEMSVANGLKRCIRVLLHWNTDRTASEIRHVYIREAQQLRPDLEEQAG